MGVQVSRICTIFYGESVLEIFASFDLDLYVRTCSIHRYHSEASKNLQNALDVEYGTDSTPVPCICATWGSIHGGRTLNVHHLFHNDRHHHPSWQGSAFYGGSQRDSQMRTNYPAPPKRFRVEEMFCH
jgi:hypothetical protein